MVASKRANVTRIIHRLFKNLPKFTWVFFPKGYVKLTMTASKSILYFILFNLTILHFNAQAQSDIKSLKAGFKTPPSSAYPRTWWHWTNSNVSKDGITKDLEWMKRIGIAGFQLSDVAYGSGQTAPEKTIFGSPAWLEAVKHTSEEAKRLNLEMAVFSSPGWSLTGGPWVKPEQAMKKLVWSETEVQGGKQIKQKLPDPPSNEGAIQNAGNKKGYYADFSVLAFKLPTTDLESDRKNVRISTSGGMKDTRSLVDKDLNTLYTLKPESRNTSAWVLFTYPKAMSTNAITIGGRRGIPFGKLQYSTDGKQFKNLAEFPGKQGYRGGNLRTFSFPAVAAKFFRVGITSSALRPADVISQSATLPDSAYFLTELQVHQAPTINRWEDKAGFNFLFEYSGTATPDIASPGIIDPKSIINLTHLLKPDGSLQWNAPAGRWKIMRFGYSLTGAKNRPAVPAALGYEVDKLSKEHTESYIKSYTDILKKAAGSLYGTQLSHIMMDSWEAGIQNWTDNMPEEFRRRRGYDLTPFLPALTGKLVGSAEISDRFLWDFRRTLVDMFAENHYGTITSFLNKEGIKTYGEAGGVSLESMEDALLNKKFVDIPMGEFWVKDLHPSSMYYQDVRGAASAGHVYGKNIVAAEAYTGGNYESPYTLKEIGDYWFTQGINRIVFHTSAHQINDSKPGNAMVGTHLHRNITWAEKAKPFIDYLARNSYMLQQGTYVADVAYLLNEGAPSTMPFWGAGLQPELPEGYQYDYLNKDVLLNLSSVKNGKLQAGQQEYAVLVLPETNEMTLPTLRKLKELVYSGAVIAGPKPVKTPGLEGFPSSEDELKALADEIWGDLDGNSKTMRNYGSGKVFWGNSLKQVLEKTEIAPDLLYSKPLDSELSWIHRKTDEAEIYFVVNRSEKKQNYQIRLRAGNKKAERWNPDSGETEALQFTSGKNSTEVNLTLEGNESVFIVLQENGPSNEVTGPFNSAKENILQDLSKDWMISFSANKATPQSLSTDSLNSWTESSDPSIKYFSGTATYDKSFKLNAKALQENERVYLDLGDVADVAEVQINGVSAGLLWKNPYRIEVSKLLKKGSNQIRIMVTNEWTNRLIGDKLNPEKKVLDSYIQPFGADYQLTNSGLLGPVYLISETKH